MLSLVETLTNTLLEKQMKLVCAESCTGGMLAAIMTHRAGASKVFDRGYVTYSNESKQELLGVSANILKTYGAVSSECALAMAQGALEKSQADIAISITGIAGPDGDEKKPVGLVHFGYALKNGYHGTIEENFSGDRSAIREQSVTTALTCLISILEEAA